MSQFIINEAWNADPFSEEEKEEEEEEEEEENNAQESNFIDDNTIFSDQAPSDYRQVASVLNLEQEDPPFENVELTYEESMKIADELKEEWGDDFFSEPIHEEDDETKGWEKRINKFEETLSQRCEKSKDSFF